MAQPWPGSLQQFFSEDNFSEELDGGVIRTDMDVGPAKTRRRYTKGVNPMSVSIYLNGASEYTIFTTFFNTTLAGGSLPFTHDHPITGTPTDFRFKAGPRISSLGGGQFIARFDLEELP